MYELIVRTIQRSPSFLILLLTSFQQAVIARFLTKQVLISSAFHGLCKYDRKGTPENKDCIRAHGSLFNCLLERQMFIQPKIRRDNIADLIVRQNETLELRLAIQIASHHPDL